MNKLITVHTIVKNEENWIWYALMSVIDYVDKLIVFDTGSNDNTVEIIKSIKSEKIIFEKKGKVTKNKFHILRQEMIDRTETKWFMILDGDEVWTKAGINELVNKIRSASKRKEAVLVPQWTCMGDVFHYSKSMSQIKNVSEFPNHIGWTSVRAIKKTKGIYTNGEYGYESYFDKNNLNVSYWTKNRLLLLSTKYFHMTFLPRSSSIKKDREVMMRAYKRHFIKGLPFPKEVKLPEVFYLSRPEIVPDPFKKHSIIDDLIGLYYRFINFSGRIRENV